MNRRLRVILVACGVTIILPLAWYLGSPLFVNMTVDEAFPISGASEPAQAEIVEKASAGMGRPEETMPEIGETITLVRGQFGEIDAIHKGEGLATVYQLPDGRRVLRFENFKVTNGPDLYVYLSGHSAPRDSAQLHEGTAVEVARLKGNIGAQNYELPAGIDLSEVKSVVIYCKRFSVVFSTAELIARR